MPDHNRTYAYVMYQLRNIQGVRICRIFNKDPTVFFVFFGEGNEIKRNVSVTLISLMFAMYKNIKVKVLKTPRRAIIVQFKLSTRYYHPTCLRWENMNVIDFQFDRLDTKCQIHIIGEMGTQRIHSLQLRDGCLRGERPAP